MEAKLKTKNMKVLCVVIHAIVPPPITHPLLDALSRGSPLELAKGRTEARND